VPTNSLNLGLAVRAGILALQEPLPDALAVEHRAAAGQGLGFAVEGTQAHGTRRVRLRHNVDQLLSLLRGGRLLRDALVEQEQQVVVVGGQIAVHERPDLVLREAALEHLPTDVAGARAADGRSAPYLAAVEALGFDCRRHGRAGY